MKITAFVSLALVLGGSASAAAVALSTAPSDAGPQNHSAASAAADGATANEAHSAATQAPPALQEVVVTAEKRTTNLQQTPIAATVLTGTDLLHNGVITVDQLETVSPSLAIDNFGQGDEFNIRGIGKAEHNTQTQAGVITYMNGVASFPGYLEDEPFYDISSVEVLRGPQGTFAGENSTGGAVYITEAAPNFNGTNGYVVGQYGNYSDAMLQGAVNLPVSDTVSTRVAFYDEYRSTFFHVSGPYTGGNGGLKQSSIRFSLLWKPSDKLSALWQTSYSYIDNGGYPASPAAATTPLYYITANAQMDAIDQIARSTLNVNYKMDDGITLRSITGIAWGRSVYITDLDGTDRLPFTFHDLVPAEMYSQEFDLISPEKGFLTWVTGAYYQGLDYSYPPVQGFYVGYPAGLYDQYIDGKVPNDTAAAFGQLGFHFSDGWKLQLGARYSWNDTTNRVYNTIPEFDYNEYVRQSEHDDRLTGKADLSWTVNDNNYLYAFVATGYKQGGLNLPIGAQYEQPFRAENVTDYELGWKASALDDHLRTQLDGYYDKYHNFQVTIGAPLLPTQMLEVNSPSPTTLYGVEFSAQAALGHFSFNANLGWERTSLGSFFAVDQRIPAVGTCDPMIGPSSLSCVNLSGHPQSYAPGLTYNFGPQYAFDLAGDSTLTMRANYSHVGFQWATLFDNAGLGDYLGARNLLSADVTYGLRDWTFTLYGTNLTNEAYVAAADSGLRWAGDPRQYGIRVMKTF
ncbi:MAG TPA: TonB-dependent receptor [Steroidobacteraceae bacterium]|nr:TonB-dependent receptor [Steroidobacteraceae bacterium]